MAKYIVTGGCGFIGGQLVHKLLSIGHEVIVIDDLSNGHRKFPDAQYVEENVAHYEKIVGHFKGVDGCFHLAAKPSIDAPLKSWFQFHESNLTTSLCAFKAAIEAGGIPVVYASSCSVYGEIMNLPLKEDEHAKPVSSYACDKLSTEQNAFFLQHEYKLPNIGLRFFNVYGPHQVETSPYSGVITRFITHLLKNEPLTVFGDGLQTRDFIFVEDIVNNLILAMKNLRSGAHIVNLSTEKSVSINDLIHHIEAIVGEKAIVNYTAPRPDDIKHSLGSHQKMQEYGFSTHTDLQTGLKATIDYFQSIL